MGRALIIVDVQNDFCEGGSLAVAGGAAVAGRISRLLEQSAYDAVVATADHHIDPGGHFSEQPDYLYTWPAHCVAGTEGAQLHPDLDRGPIEAVFDKGAHAAAYSGFEGSTPSSHDDPPVPLDRWLAERAVDEVDICGIATDHCVRATALDAVARGLSTRVLLDLTAGVARPTTVAALAQLREAGVQLVGRPWVGDGPVED